ncbi:MAG: GNAT family N-acetyltransferase [Actinobacteria bacterium]|nr:GNAT family N-acetyltransferase [Actinomycetota bacterium]
MADLLRPINQADLPELFELQRRVEVHDNIPIVTPWEEFEEMADDPSINLATGSVMMLRDDQAIGYGVIWARQAAEADLAKVLVLGTVDPQFRRQGVGSQILAWTIERGRELLATAAAHQERFVRTHVYDFETDAIALFERQGMNPIRYYAEMIRPLSEPIVSSVPKGIEIVGWDEERSEEVRQVLNGAFRDHWGSIPLDEANWEHRLRHPGRRLDVSYIALADGQVVGASLNDHYPSDTELTGRLDGWIGALGTHRDFRKRGVASALVGVSFAAFRNLGWDHAMIGVDSENPTGAYGLYQQLGFRPLYRQVQHQLQV